MKSKAGKCQRREEKKREDIRKEKESEGRRCRCVKRSESREKLCFSNDLWLRRVESRLAKAAGAEPCGQMRDEKLHAVVFRPLLEVEMSKKCTPLWREAHFEVKSVRNGVVRITFGRSDVVLRGRRKGLCIVIYAPCQK